MNRWSSRLTTTAGKKIILAPFLIFAVNRTDIGNGKETKSQRNNNPT